MNDLSLINKHSLLTFIRKFVISQDILNNPETLTFDTDLVAHGVESIALLTLLTHIEQEFNVTVDLDKFEKYGFIFSVNILANSLSEK
jgi:acyl carrier protein